MNDIKRFRQFLSFVCIFGYFILDVLYLCLCSELTVGRMGPHSIPLKMIHTYFFSSLIRHILHGEFCSVFCVVQYTILLLFIYLYILFPFFSDRFFFLLRSRIMCINRYSRHRAIIHLSKLVFVFIAHTMTCPIPGKTFQL